MSSDEFVPDRERAAASDANVPVIDIAPFSAGGSGRRRVVEAIARACEDVGFFGIVGHGVDDALIDGIYREGRAFFALPREEKMEVGRPAPGVSRGYNSLSDQSLGNTLASGVPPDLQESFAIGPLDPGNGPHWTVGYGPIHFHPNLWPQRPAAFRAAVTAYWQTMETLAGRLARIFALALDLPEDFFADKIDRHVSTMRLNFYPAQPVAPLPGQIRAGAHSDYGGFTILRTEDAPGGTPGRSPRRQLGRRAEHPERLRRQHRRHADALDQRPLGLDRPPRGQPAGIRAGGHDPHVSSVFPGAELRRRGAMPRELHRSGQPAALCAHDRGRALARQDPGGARAAPGACRGAAGGRRCLSGPEPTSVARMSEATSGVPARWATRISLRSCGLRS